MARLWILIGLLWQAPLALACGYCVEDKIASTYDHAVVTRALQSGRHVAFFHVEGAETPGRTTPQALRALVNAVPGVDGATVRVSLDTFTLSFAFDPARASLASINARLDRKLSASGLSLMSLRVMERPADLKILPRAAAPL